MIAGSCLTNSNALLAFSLQTYYNLHRKYPLPFHLSDLLRRLNEQVLLTILKKRETQADTTSLLYVILYCNFYQF